MSLRQDCGANFDKVGGVGLSCDCESPSLYFAKIVKTRKPHQCFECGSDIEVGSLVEKADGLWDGMFQTIYTCNDCVRLRDYLRAKFPDACQLRCHGELTDFIWESSFMYSEVEIEREAASWIENYDNTWGVVRGSHCVIASLTPCIERKNGRFRLSEGYGT